jgi:hypothetical protein
MYASSKGTIKLADMRQNALCDIHAKRMCLMFPFGIFKLLTNYRI